MSKKREDKILYSDEPAKENGAISLEEMDDAAGGLSIVNLPYNPSQPVKPSPLTPPKTTTPQVFKL